MISIDGGPAFPVESYDAESGMDTVKPGMSLRDWFAGQALGAILRNAETISIEPDIGSREARLAYAVADAMLAARVKE